MQALPVRRPGGRTTVSPVVGAQIPEGARVARLRRSLRGRRGVLALAAYLGVFAALRPVESALGWRSTWAALLAAVTLFAACVVGLAIYAWLGRTPAD